MGGGVVVWGRAGVGGWGVGGGRFPPPFGVGSWRMQEGSDLVLVDGITIYGN